MVNDSDNPVSEESLTRRNIVTYDYHLTREHPLSANIAKYARLDGDSWFDMHAALECGIVIEGRVRRFIGEKGRELGPGDPWFCGSYELNGYQLVEVPVTVLVLMVDPLFLASQRFPEAPHVNFMRPFLEATASGVDLSSSVKEGLQSLGRRAVTYAEEHNSLSGLMPRILMMEMLGLILPADPSTVEPPSGETLLQRLTPAIDLVRKSQKLVTIEEGAEVCGMSRDRFIFYFKKTMGINFAKFAIRHRVRAAAAELVSTKAPIKAVARNWGFTDESHLWKVFQKHYGCTPAEFRRTREFPGGGGDEEVSLIPSGDEE
jgi:AraC-like DNA-binding protein